MTKQLVHSFTMIVLAAASLSAEPRITAQIPFPFHVGDSILPAGSYTADTDAAQGVLRLKSADCKSSVMVLSHAVQSPAGDPHAKLVFTRYGDEYFLFQVWHGTDTGRELRKSRREIEVAAGARGSRQTVLAGR